MRQRKNGFFITFEGGEGLGKSTQAKLLADWMTAQGKDVVLTREPGATELGKTLRELLLNADVEVAKPAQMLLFQADRAQHYKDVLKPSLRAGRVVICDRFFDTTMAYQGAGQGWSRSLLLRLHHATTGMLLPNLTFVFSGTPHRSMDQKDRYERAESAFHARVKQEFERLPSIHPRYVRIEASRAVEDVTAEIRAITAQRLGDSGL